MFRLAAATVAALALAPPVAFTQPTSIELEPRGTLLVVEQSVGRILRVDPANGRSSVVARGLTKPYALVRAPSGALYYSAGRTVRRLGGRVVARNADYIGPIAIDREGTIYYATASGGVWRLGGGRIAAKAPIVSPHGLAVASDGSLLVSDTGGNRLVRIDASGAAETFGAVSSPRGLDVARDGRVYVVDAGAHRVVRFAADGRRLGELGPPLPGDPYDLQVARDGSVYVLEAGERGDVRRIDARGRMTVISRG